MQKKNSGKYKKRIGNIDEDYHYLGERGGGTLMKIIIISVRGGGGK